MTRESLQERQLLLELFCEAEQRGLGTVVLTFTPTPGREEQAKAFIAARGDFLIEIRPNQ